MHKQFLMALALLPVSSRALRCPLLLSRRGLLLRAPQAGGRRRILGALRMCSASPVSAEDDLDGMPFARLASTIEAIEAQPARLKGVALMTDLLSFALLEAPDELLPCLAIATMQLTPSTRPLKLGVGESLVVQALAQACDRPIDELKAELRRSGDLGALAARVVARDSAALPATDGGGPNEAVAAVAAAAAPAVRLRVQEVHACLLEMGTTSGKGANGRKAELLAALLGRASPKEALLLVRAVRSQLRSGIGDKGIRDALAAAVSAVARPPSEVAAAEALAAEADAEVARAAALELEAVRTELGEAAAAAGDWSGDMSDAKASVAQIDKLRGDWASLAKASLAPKERKRLEERAKATRAAQRAAARAHKNVDKLRAASRRRAAALVSEAFSVAPCYHTLVSALLERGVWRLLEATGVRAGVPVQPMAATASPSIEAALARLVGRPFLCEWKYDGERCQAHLLPPSEAEVAERSRVRLYSRSLDEVSARFPEIVDALPAALGAVMGADGTHVPTSSAVVDAELCAIDEATGEVLPFQSLAVRPRKAPTDAQLAAGPRVCVFAFDLLELNGVSLLNEPLRDRRQKLRALLRPIPHRVQLAQGVEVSNEQELRDELERAFEAQAEGLMLKCLVPGGAALPQAAEGAAEQGVAAGAGYEAGKRSLQWLKLKRDYLDGMGDSFDLVPIGAYMGRGKRAGAYGAYLLAVYSPETKLYQPICKLGSGLSDVELAHWSEQAESHACTEEEARELYDLPGTLPPLMAPHVWLRPRVIWEVSAAEVSISPIYRAAFGLVAEDKGLALRFPRFVRERPDKGPAQATTDGQLASVFNTQPTASAREGVGGAGPGEVEGV